MFDDAGYKLNGEIECQKMCQKNYKFATYLPITERCHFWTLYKRNPTTLYDQCQMWAKIDGMDPGYVGYKRYSSGPLHCQGNLPPCADPNGYIDGLHTVCQASSIEKCQSLCAHHDECVR